MTADILSPREDELTVENTGLRRLLAQAGIDAAERTVAERLQRLLVKELHHRVKNTLATVMAITSQSLRGAKSLEQGRQAIESRLMALGRAHDLLLRSSFAGASLATVIRDAVEPYDTQGDGRFVLRGAEIHVASAAVLALAMVLNELCTNAAKYGALSTAEGHVEIGWTVDEAAQQFKLTWTEEGGPVVQERSQPGFGTHLIERSLAGHLHGAARLMFEPAGVVCELAFPLGSLRTPHQDWDAAYLGNRRAG
jgi:two-component sensor histidine kinase